MDKRNSYTIQLDHRINTFYESELFFSCCKKMNFNYEIYIDFKLISYLNICGIFNLINLYNQLNLQKDTKIIFLNFRFEILTYLTRLNFFEAIEYKLTFNDCTIYMSEDEFDYEFDYEKLSFLKIDPINIIKSDIELMQIYPQINGKLDTWFDLIKYEGAKSSLSIMIRELLANSIEHSGKEVETGKGYYLLQSRDLSNTGKYISIGIGDLGIGLKNSMLQGNLKGADDKSDVFFLEKLLSGYTSRKNGNGGRGYQFVQKTLKDLSGEMTIRSTKAMITMYGDENIQYQKLEQEMLGTQCIFNFILKA